MQRHYYVIHSLLINSMRLTNDDKSSIKLLRQERDGVQNVFVKSFLTRSGQSVLLKIFCARFSTHIALVFCHCDIMLLGYFDSIVIFQTNF